MDPTFQAPHLAVGAGVVRFKGDYHHTGDGTVAVRLYGEIDMSADEPLRQVLNAALTAEPTPQVIVVDLSELRFLDCAGVRVLVETHGSAHALGASLVACHPRPLVERVLRVTGVADLLGMPEASAKADRLR